MMQDELPHTLCLECESDGFIQAKVADCMRLPGTSEAEALEWIKERDTESRLRARALQDQGWPYMVGLFQVCTEDLLPQWSDKSRTGALQQGGSALDAPVRCTSP